MKSLCQHILEKLIINKNYKNDIVYKSFNDFYKAIEEFSDDIILNKDVCHTFGDTDYSICIMAKNYKISTKRYGGIICPQITLFWNKSVNGFYFWLENKQENEIIVDKNDNEYEINVSELDVLEKTKIKHRTQVLDTYVFSMNDHNIEVLVNKIIYIANNQ